MKKLTKTFFSICFLLFGLTTSSIGLSEEASTTSDQTVTALDGQIQDLKKERNAALEAHDHKKLKEVRRQIKKLKNKLRNAMV